ncbi:MAG: phosphatidate cytidylyltransferase [Bacteroidia bacterium]|nr:phosphatidate cytidylyltransferase [Bacteroidia bacterium]
MNALIEQLSIPPQVTQMVGVVLLILILASLIGNIWSSVKPGALVDEILLRVKSWWFMTAIFLLALLIHPALTFISIGTLSFLAFRELFSIGTFQSYGRSAIFWAYLSIPIQYFFAYMGWLHAFLTFIPVFLFVWMAFWIIIQDQTEKVVVTLAVLPAMVILTVYGLSHMAFLLSLPQIEGFSASGKGLLFFLVFLTEINDVMQFIWGKVFGKTKILPQISPGKTVEGLLGGMISSIIIGISIRFLTPLSLWQVMLVSMVLSFTGFIGDVVMSAIKRNIGIKDTGKSIPGHGGILDRIDSLTLTSSVFFHLLYFMCYA